MTNSPIPSRVKASVANAMVLLVVGKRELVWRLGRSGWAGKREHPGAMRTAAGERRS